MNPSSPLHHPARLQTDPRGGFDRQYSRFVLPRIHRAVTGYRALPVAHDLDVTEQSRREEWHIAGRYYQTTMASDVIRDGMALEVEDVAPAPARGIVVEVFYSDQTGDMTFSTLTKDPLPIDLIERTIAKARRRLPPAPSDD